ncbi:MAG TPA: AraC family transcriptional regulator [Caldithrix abyssi]|uniref:AraC family transcriptional regulator n=1 Tax=Caldithrix abyssi TaxID=187145 RepID=A0A7V1LJU4_CALAY|nr:AraC family transcriptional regulator [Caldithrix abyssi]
MDKPEIREAGERKLLGLRMVSTVSDNRTFELWSRFRPRVREIRHRKGDRFYSVQHFPDNFSLSTFSGETRFDKWAAVEVTDHRDVPEGMETLILPAGQYAVFIHRGAAREFHRTFQYIFGHWLPYSGYDLDARPQFEIMEADYRPDDPGTEEQVWIPVRPKPRRNEGDSL